MTIWKSVPRRLFALLFAALATTAMALAGSSIANATTPTDGLVTVKQVCYLDPGKGRVCTTVYSAPGVIYPKTN